MLPIEPGCLAILIRGVSRGKSLTVVDLGAPPTPLRYVGSDTIWHISEPIYWHKISGDAVLLPLAPESALMRIDGGEFAKEREAEGVA